MSLFDAATTKFRNYQEELQTSGVVAAVFNFFQGRSTAFAIVFTVCGLILAFRGKLTMEYSMLVTAIQALVFAHSCKEDWHQQNMAEIQKNITTATVTTDTTTVSSVPKPILVPLVSKLDYDEIPLPKPPVEGK